MDKEDVHWTGQLKKNSLSWGPINNLGQTGRKSMKCFQIGISVSY